MTDILFRLARLIDPASDVDIVADLLVRDGKILDRGTNLGKPDSATVIDGRDLVLAPGLVDMRVGIGEPGFEYRETIASAAGEMEAMGIKNLLDSSGIAAVLVGDSVLPNFPFEVRVARDQVDRARLLIADAEAKGPAAAEEAERASEA